MTVTKVLLACAPADRDRLVGSLRAAKAIEVVGCTRTAADTLASVARLRPHVLVVVVSQADDLRTAIPAAMAANPLPILALSHRHEPAAAIEALADGAVEALPVEAEPVLLHDRIAVLRGVMVVRRRQPAQPAPRVVHGAARIVAVAASTGGPPALLRVLLGLGGLAAPVVVVQHLHADFVTGLVNWLDSASPLPVELARDGQLLRPGVVHLAPSGTHLRLTAGGTAELDPEPRSLHRPSADELFASVALHAGARSIGVVLTGMGDDGARGLRAMHDVGAVTIGQDEETCAVFGMPKAAWERGAVQQLLALDAIAPAIVSAAARLVGP